MARSMEVYERIHVAYDDLYDPQDVERTRVRDLSGSGTTVVTAVAIFCLYEALSDAQLNAYKPIYGGRQRITGVFHNDVYYLLKSKDLRMINYAGVSDGILWCFKNQMVRTLHKELDASEKLRSAHCIVGEFSSQFEVYLPQPNPYDAHSLRVVMQREKPALFAMRSRVDGACRKVGVGAKCPDEGPNPDQIIQYEKPADLIEAILKWTFVVSEAK